MEPDQHTEGDQERRQLLEEIRRRSEEAELKRIEEELERSAPPAQEAAPPPEPSPPPEPAPPPPEAPSPFPLPAPESTPLPLSAVNEQKAMVLRERFLIALDRGKLEKAAEILTELSALVPHDERLPGFRARLHDAQETQAQLQEQRAAARHVEPPAVPQHEEDQGNRVLELLEAANASYQQEKYDEALMSVDEALALDPQHEEAMRLRELIEKAQHLADLIRREEARHRQEEDLVAPAVEQPPPAPAIPDKDPWGSAAPPVDMGLQLPPEEKGPAAPPKPPLIDRVTGSVARIRVPVKPLVTGAAILAVLVALYVVIDSIRTTVVPPQASLLVLPATVVEGDSSAALLADGLTEEVVGRLLSASELRVINTPTAFMLRRSPLAPVQLARSVGSGHLLRWGVALRGETAALTAEIADTVSGAAVWSFAQQASLRELPALMRELQHGVLGAVSVKLTSDEEAALSGGTLPPGDAYLAYVRARGMQRRAEPAQQEAARQALLQAVTLDSTFAPAWSALGWMEVLGFERATAPDAAQLGQAFGCVQKAVGLGSRTSETFRVWGMVEQGRLDLENAVRRFDEAVSLSPSDAESQRRYAEALVAHGKSDEALHAAQRAVSDDPANLASYTMLGMVHHSRGEYQDALRSYEVGLKLAPDRSAYAAGFYADMLVYLQQHDRAMELYEDRLARQRQSAEDLYRLGRVEQSAGKAKQTWQEVLQRAKEILNAELAQRPNDPSTLSLLALVSTRLGEFKAALTTMERALQAAPENPRVLYMAARVSALQRDKRQALAYLSQAIEKRFSLAAILDMDFFTLSTDPDFVQTITR